MGFPVPGLRHQVPFVWLIRNFLSFTDGFTDLTEKKSLLEM